MNESPIHRFTDLVTFYNRREWGEDIPKDVQKSYNPFTWWKAAGKIYTKPIPIQNAYIDKVIDNTNSNPVNYPESYKKIDTIRLIVVEFENNNFYGEFVDYPKIRKDKEIGHLFTTKYFYIRKGDHDEIILYNYDTRKKRFIFFGGKKRKTKRVKKKTSLKRLIRTTMTRIRN